MLVIADISCTDKDRVLAALESGHELPNGSRVAILLEQNFPNPFISATTISYRVGISSPGSILGPLHIRLRVMTEDWSEVKTLADSVHRSGYYHVMWYVDRNTPSGEYLGVLEGGGVTEVIRMRLIK